MKSICFNGEQKSAFCIKAFAPMAAESAFCIKAFASMAAEKCLLKKAFV
ncbi:hypothetical protein OU678_10515 [Escherichia coli]|nr:hypothetical protein [Escherichia coli]